MNLQNRDLSVRMRGEDVRLLHDELRQLGFNDLESERVSSLYGAETERAVKVFQERQGLEVTGIVDATTVARINAEVEVQQSVQANSMVVNVRVRHADGRPVSGATIQAIDRDLRNPERLGEATTDARGRCRIVYDAGQFRRAEKRRADLIVRASGSDLAEPVSSPTHFNAEPITWVDLVVGGERYRGPSEFERLVNLFTPLLPANLSFADLTEEDDHPERKDISFLSGETGQSFLRVALFIKAHRLAKKTRIDAEVFFGLFREGLPTILAVLLATSEDALRRGLLQAVEDNVIPERFGKQVDEILRNLRGARIEIALESSREGRLGTLAQVFSGVLPDREERAAFISMFANHSGPIKAFWDSVRDHPQLGRKLNDLQFTARLDTLTRSHMSLIKELQRMKDAREIQQLSDLARLDEEQWIQILHRPSGRDRIGVPDRIPGNDDEARTRNYAREMVHTIEDSFPTAFVTHRLEHDNLPGGQEVLTFLRANPAYNLRRDRLDRFLRDNPHALAGLPDPQKARKYIKAVQRIYRLAPRCDQMSALLKGGVDSAHAIARMGRGYFIRTFGQAVGGESEAWQIHQCSLQTTATAVNLITDFVYGKVSSSAWDDPRIRDVPGVPEWSALFGSLELCGCQHCRSVYSPAAYFVDVLQWLSDRPSKIAGTSAKDVLFSRRPELGDIELNCENTNTPMPYVDLVNEVLENAVTPPPPFENPVEVKPPVGATLVDLETDLNDRKLSDRLRNAFVPPLSVDAAITVSNHGKPWHVDSPSWSIDEPEFTYSVRKEGGKLSVVSRSLQTKGSAAERAANAQYLNRQAYEILRKQVYPWNAPFDLWWEQARVYLEHLGVPRHELIEIFLFSDQKKFLLSPEGAYEFVGLTTFEASIITGITTGQPEATSQGPWNLWGFESESLTSQTSLPDPADNTKRISTGQWLQVISDRVDVFLQQSGLSYMNLLDLLGSYFINPVVRNSRAIQIVSTDLERPDTCELNKLKLVREAGDAGLEEGLDEPTALKIVRFVRLWRKVGWDMRDLDRTITAFPPAVLDNRFIIWIAHVERLRRELNFPVVRLLSWWSPIDTALYIDHRAPDQPLLPPLYAQLFRNRAVTNPLDPGFSEDAADLTGTLSGRRETIRAALGLSAPDFEALFNHGDVIPKAADGQPDDKLSLDHLSRLHRHATLAKAIKLSIPDYLRMIELVDKDPFDNPAETILFIRNVNTLRDAGFSPEELDYLLRHKLSDTSNLAPREEIIAEVLSAIRAGLQTIAAENTYSADATDPNGPTTDTNGNLTRQKLALLDWDAALMERVVTTLTGAVTYETNLDPFPPGLELPNATEAFAVELAALPAGFVFPASLAELVDYNAPTQQLRASRALTPIERIELQNAAQAANDGALTAAVDALLLLQDELEGVISFDQQTRKLRFKGPMTVIRRDRLLNVSPTNGEYQNAIRELFAQPRVFVSREMRTFSVHNFATQLAALPTALADKEVPFPKALRSKVYFDGHSEDHMLHFVGAMTEAERTALLDLSDDSAYRAAIDALFTAPQALASDVSDSFLTAPALVTEEGTGTDAGEMFDDPKVPEDRFRRVLEKLLPHLRLRLSERLVAERLAESLTLEVPLATALLTRWVASPIDSTPDVAAKRRSMAEFLDSSFANSDQNLSVVSSAFQAQFKTYLLLHKVATLVTRFKITSPALAWLFEYGPAVGWLNLNSLPVDAQAPGTSFQKWLRIADLFALRDGLPRGESLLARIFSLAREPGVGSDDLLQRLADLSRWDLEQLKFLVGTDGFNIALPDALRDELILTKLLVCFRAMRRLGMSPRQCRELCEGQVTQAEASSVLQAVRAKYEEDQWLTLAKPLRDVLREKQRAALVAYLIHRLKVTPSLRDTNDLYAHFLIDVEMSPCMMTSRIKQAISSTQLFVQRCLMNLEVDVAPNGEQDDAWLWWKKWMQNYRMWEANRKVFLYPENWIEPELRDDKSPFFKELESALLQSDLNRESAEGAVHAYLEKLDQVARLEPVGMYHQMEATNSGNKAVDILHVFARTVGAPPVYYYRKREDSEWTAWERIDADIESNPKDQGVHLIPVVWNRRLFLFWPTIMEKPRPVQVSLVDGNMDGPDPDVDWEIKLAWSEYRQGKWASKRISSAAISIPKVQHLFDPVGAFVFVTPSTYVRIKTTPELSMLFFRSRIDENNALSVILSPRSTPPENDPDPELHPPMNRLFAFFFNGCQPTPTVTLASADLLQQDTVSGTEVDHMFLAEQEDESISLFLPPQHTKVLGRTPGVFRLLLPHEYGTSIGSRPGHPFFYFDDKHTFFVMQTGPSLQRGARAAIDIGDTPQIFKEEIQWPDVAGPIVNPAEHTQFKSTYAVKEKKKPDLLEASGYSIQVLSLDWGDLGSAATLKLQRQSNLTGRFRVKPKLWLDDLAIKN